MKAAGFATTPYHVYVPSFGDWGFVIAREGVTPLNLENAHISDSKLPLRYLSSISPSVMTSFDVDTNRIPSEPSTLDHPLILYLYERGAKKWE